VRNEREQLAMAWTLAQTARDGRHEEARNENARNTRDATKQRNKATRAPACNTPSVWNRRITHAGQTQKKMLCRLTLELSGGVAVRLE
jgi:hypothetical protein